MILGAFIHEHNLQSSLVLAGRQTTLSSCWIMRDYDVDCDVDTQIVSQKFCVCMQKKKSNVGFSTAVSVQTQS